MLILVNRPDIDWHAFVSNTQIATGVSPTRALDSLNIPAGSLSSFIMAVGQIENPDVPPHIFLKSSFLGNALDHLFFTFFFSTDESVLLEVLKIENFAVTACSNPSRHQAGLITGTLRQFRDLVIIGMEKDKEISVREFLKDMYAIFIALGLRDLFNDLVPRRMVDHSICLEKP